MTDKKKEVQKKKQKTKPGVLPDEEYNRKWDQEQNFKFIKRVNDPRFGEIGIIKNKNTNQILMIKEKMATSKKEATKDIMDLKQRMRLNNTNMLNLINYSTAVKKELCSTSYLSKGFYEFPRTDMQKEVNDRKDKMTDFSHFELQSMGDQTLSGLNHLHAKNIAHGDIKPKNIGFNRNTNQFKILDRLADPSPIEKAQMNNLINKKDIYMSPQLYNKVQGKNRNVQYDPKKSDLYSLGMSILYCGNQDSVQDCYKSDGTINEQVLQNHLSNFDNKYRNQNPHLSNMVHSLLQKDESAREVRNQNVFSHNQGVITNSQPQTLQQTTTTTTFTNQNERKVQGGQPMVVYKQDDFFNPKVHSNVQSQPQTLTQTNNSTPQYSYNIPKQTTYDNKYMKPIDNTTTTYTTTQTYEKPKNTYVNTTPVQYQNVDTYVSDPKQVVYVNKPQHIQAKTEPMPHYVQSQPQTTYVSNPNQGIDGLTLKNTYIDYKTGDSKYQTSNKFNNEHRTTYVNTQPQTITTTENYVQSQPKVIYTQPQTITTNENYVQSQPKVIYTQPQTITTNENYVQSHPQVIYTQPQTTNVTYVQPQTTENYVQSKPQVVYNERIIQSKPMTETKYMGQTVTEGGQTYYPEKHKSFVFMNVDMHDKNVMTTHPQQVQTIERVVNTQPQVTYERVVSNQPHVQTYTTGQNVEIRRGSHIPTKTQTKQVKKKYVMKEDGTVIEVEVQEDDDELQSQPQQERTA